MDTDTVEKPPETVSETVVEPQVELPIEPAEPEVVVDEKGEEIKDTEKAVHFRKDGPPEGSKRWKEIYHAAKEGERKVAELEAKFKERDADIEALRKHNEDLAKSVVAKEQEKQESALTKSRTDEQNQLSTLRAAKKEAIAEGDYEKAFAIEDQVTELILHIAKPKPEEIRKLTKTVTAEEEMATVVNAFKKETPWFEPRLPDGRKNPNYDAAKRGMAIALEFDMTPGWTGSYRELINDVKRQVEERFDKKVDIKPPIPGVAGVSPKAIPISNTPAQLTSDQKRVVRMMFGDDPDGEKKYALQLKAMGRV